jgi:hypothetical protein
MKRFSFNCLAGSAMALAVALAPAIAIATPNINGAVILPRVFNDCPGSTFSSANAYPASLDLEDISACFGGINLHNWRLSDNGGATAATFANGDAFRYCADLVLTGNGVGEAGLNITPWWSVADGRLNVKTAGEIAAFGGRLPFFSFTGSFGINYTPGELIRLEIVYMPNDLTMANPATIEYRVTYQANFYTSGPLAFDEGNPAEDPPHGLWGILTPAEVGGHFQMFMGDSGIGGLLHARFLNICYEALDVIPVEQSTWGAVKALYR